MEGPNKTFQEILQSHRHAQMLEALSKIVKTQEALLIEIRELKSLFTVSNRGDKNKTSQGGTIKSETQEEEDPSPQNGLEGELAGMLSLNECMQDVDASLYPLFLASSDAFDLFSSHDDVVKADRV